MKLTTFQKAMVAVSAGALIAGTVIVSEDAPNPAVEPLTYQRTVVWDAHPTAESFVLTINGTNQIATTATSVTAELLAGTNSLVLTAVRGADTASASTNVALDPIRIVGVDLVTAAALTGPWTVTALPPPQTNPAGAPVYFQLKPWVTNSVAGRHL